MERAMRSVNYGLQGQCDTNRITSAPSPMILRMTAGIKGKGENAYRRPGGHSQHSTLVPSAPSWKPCDVVRETHTEMRCEEVYLQLAKANADVPEEVRVETPFEAVYCGPAEEVRLHVGIAGDMIRLQ